jgi:predicted transcriptional regulator
VLYTFFPYLRVVKFNVYCTIANENIQKGIIYLHMTIGIFYTMASRNQNLNELFMHCKAGGINVSLLNFSGLEYYKIEILLVYCLMFSQVLFVVIYTCLKENFGIIV